MNQVVLKTEGLTKRYGALTAVDSLSLEVRAGEIFGFLGPNGAGKTTSIHMMCGLLKPNSGAVFIHGHALDVGDRLWRRRVGMCPQSLIVWEKLTCLEQLIYVGELYGLKRSAARQAGLRLLDELDLAAQGSQLGGTLSGGMQRRLNLALALVHNPEIVVLDEPEAGLDPQSRLLVREVIHSLARKKTVILTTHNMDEAERLVDRVAIIDHGRLLVLDTPQALKQRLGQGDVIEITLIDCDLVGLEERLSQAFQLLSSEISLDRASSTVRLRALQAVNHLPQILDTFTRLDLQAGGVAIRPNSLEDVFIQLTGRGLRE
jgi:ABC-2 type transport system ATP-binding protein